MQIPKIKLIPVRESPGVEDAIGYMWNEAAGRRHFLGGLPEEVSNTSYLKCDRCQETMTFYAQIDSIGDQ